MPVALVRGARLNVLQVDEPQHGHSTAPREDLIMVHGLAANLAFWYMPYAQAFAKRFRVTLFDLRGHGRSEATPDGYTPQELGQDLLGLMDELGIRRAHLVAHSFGGVVALNAACREPARVASLVLCDTHISAARRHSVPRDWSNRAHVQAVLDRHGLVLDTHDPYFGYRLLTEVAHLQIRHEPVGEDLLALVGPMLGRNGKRTAAQWVKLMDETAAGTQLMGDDGLDVQALHRLLFPILALYGDHSQARLTGGELLQVWPHGEFRRVRDAGHFFPVSRPADVMHECERFWRGDYVRRPVVRSGEEQRRHFRSDRVFKVDGAWHFSTRERGHIGPYDTPDEAHEALARYISDMAVTV
ncbi:alpha/beta fold hydrolase [Rubrivivax gelatinosus]|uniref:Alpha/beta hydrolase n=1 Tax=Rubrivivax gelatinosus TaxID=28068 RepID=A0ABS1DSG1_RUBGE|nr:alpha/beta fold hydrolase [Rubrivivax gelatinosus]MBK1712115.1 alpha/beta hydrolase [Rubrivivax gelatinosus]